MNTELPMSGEARKRAGRGPTLIALLLAIAVAVAWARVAPPERSLGTSIRIVYLHVAATWAGIAVLYGVGIGGLISTLRPGVVPASWLRKFWVAGLMLFSIGFLLSLVSASISWGGILWSEPRVRASLGVVGMGVLATGAATFSTRHRSRDLVWPVAATLSFVILRSASLFMHPDGPIQRDTPASIKATFFGIFLVFLAVAALTAAALPERSDG